MIQSDSLLNKSEQKTIGRIWKIEINEIAVGIALRIKTKNQPTADVKI
jgi:hypothetical protein